MTEPSSPARNAPCPCGSGKKYKRCCGADLPTDEVTGEVLEIDEETGEVIRPPRSGPDLRLPLGLVLACIGIGVVVGSLRNAGDGLALGLALLCGTGIFLAARKPPASRGRDDGGASISFGMNQRENQPNRAKTRSERRSAQRKNRRKKK